MSSLALPSASRAVRLVPFHALAPGALVRAAQLRPWSSSPSTTAELQQPPVVPPHANQPRRLDAPHVQRYLVKVEYDGRPYAGAAAQRSTPAVHTVQGALEDALERFVGQRVETVFSSRTDAAVHATDNAFHVDLDRRDRHGNPVEAHPPVTVMKALNAFLRRERIRVTEAYEVPSTFSARHSVLSRTYVYRLINQEEPPSLFDEPWAWHVHEPLDLTAMQEAANAFLGTHDYTSFRGAACQSLSPVKTVETVSVRELPFTLFDRSSASLTQWQQSRQAIVIVRARSFLYHQVRNMVSALVQVGRGRLQPDGIAWLLAQRNRALAPPTAPPDGLFLAHVDYGPSYGRGTVAHLLDSYSTARGEEGGR